MLILFIMIFFLVGLISWNKVLMSVVFLLLVWLMMLILCFFLNV